MVPTIVKHTFSIGLRLLVGWKNLCHHRARKDLECNSKVPEIDASETLTALSKIQFSYLFLGEDIADVLPCIPKMISITGLIMLHCHYLLYCFTPPSPHCLPPFHTCALHTHTIYWIIGHVYHIMTPMVRMGM